MAQENSSTPDVEVNIPNEQTTQENTPTPNAPKGSFYTNSYYGLRSWAVLFLWVITIFLAYKISSIIVILFVFLIILPFIETVYAVIGLFKDKEKDIATAALILGLFPIAFVLLMIWKIPELH